MNAHCILLAVTDDPTRAFLADNLIADGHAVHPAACAAQAAARAAAHNPAVMILGALEAPGEDLALLRLIRSGHSPDGRVRPELPVLSLLPGREELALLRAFEAGADDVLTVPFSYPELRARVTALLRRCAHAPDSGVRRIGTLTIEPRSRRALIAGHPVRLANKEFALLRHLASEPTRVFTKTELLRDVWDFRCGTVTSRTVDSHAYRLRGKLAHGGAFVENVWGVGYRLVSRLDAPAPGPVAPAGAH